MKFDDFCENDGQMTGPDGLSLREKREAAAVLFLTYRHYVKAIALQFAPMHHLADEIVQEVFSLFLEKSDQLDFSKNFKGYLAALTRNIAQKHWRNESRHFSEEMRRTAEYVRRLAEEQNVDRYSEELEALRTCLEKSPKKMQQMVQMHYFGNLSMLELAEHWNLSADSVYQAFFRLRKRLRLCIEHVLKGEDAHV